MKLEPSTKVLVVDYESRSEVDLKVSGAFEYARHASTEVLCVAWRWATMQDLPKAKTEVWSPRFESPFGDLLQAFKDPDTVLIAHNSGFEAVITRHVLGERLMYSLPYLRVISPRRWLCTASLAAALALPRDLERAAKVMGLPIQKDMAGRRLLLKMCKPRKPTKHDQSKWHETETDLRRLMAYCVTDVDTEVELLLRLPMLMPSEREVWLLNQKVNARGFEVDRDLVTKALGMIDHEMGHLTDEVRHITSGEITTVNQRDVVLSWLESRGVYLPDLTAKTVADALAAGLADGDDGARRILEIRQTLSRSSTKKYRAFDARTRSDRRCRDNLMYHGASTGREAGTGVQPQNFPRGVLKDTGTAIEAVKTGDVELVRMLYGDVMSALSSCLRGCIVAPEGRLLACADYAQIEARVLFWLAGHTEGLAAFRDNRPIYEEMAAHVYRKQLHDVTPEERQLGKALILGAGFGLGHKKFRDSVKAQAGIDLDEPTAKAAINSYRTMHFPVPQLWSAYNKAAIAATLNPGKRFKTRRTWWYVRGRFLFCELPSGRRLAYFGPKVEYVPTPWEEMCPQLTHWAVNSKTKQWALERKYGGAWAENVTQAVARDIMVAAMLRCEDAGYDIVLSVHDELVAEHDDDGLWEIKDYENLMAEAPAWAEGCPIKVKGYAANRYRK